MDSHYTSQLILSMLFFAPGIVLLAGLAFVGLLMLLEKTVLRSHVQVEAPHAAAADSLPSQANPAPGPVVAGLKAAVAQQPAGQRPVAVGERTLGK